MNPKDCWHPVGLSDSFEASSSAGTRLFEQELVVWRDKNGVAHVWEDRCPHRGMKLSFGFVRGDHIACLYHGWQYNSGGHCQYIPAHPTLDVPKTIGVRVYPVLERSGMVWTSLSENPPPARDDDELVVPLRSLYLGCGFEAAISLLGDSRLAPFGAATSAATAVSRVSDTLFAVSSGQDRLLVGLQTISNGRTALHVSIVGTAERYRGAGQNHFNDWALGLRYAAGHAGVPLDRDVA